MTDQLLTDTPFTGLGLDPNLLQGIHEAGFQLCTQIQAASLPLALAGMDVAGQAQTGTGKTAAFLVAGFQHLLNHPPSPERRATQPRALILSPTRELAVQIHHDATLLGKYLDFRLGLVFGGTDYEKQRRQLEEGVDVLIGTPGRLIDYLKQHVFDLRAVQVIVIDEADRMFDLGFIADLRFLLRRLPPPNRRLGLLFSATLSYRVTELAYEHMNNPHAVRTETTRITVDRIVETCYMTANEEKIPLLLALMRQLAPPRSIIFVNTKRAAEDVWGFLEGNGFHAGLLSGDVAQRKRLQLLKGFQEGALPILVATDVASRGLHIPDVTHVFNFDLPADAEDYVHRIGRTARAGASGNAISFACESHAFSLPEIETFIGHKLPLVSIPTELLVPLDPRSRVRVERGDRPLQRPHKAHGSARPPAHRPHRESPAVAVTLAPSAETETTAPPPSAPPRRRRRRVRRGPSSSGSTGADQSATVPSGESNPDHEG